MYDNVIKGQPRLKYVEGVKTPMPLFCGGEPYEAFIGLKETVRQAVGYDFLGTLADMFRTSNFKTSKVGVAFYSIHKTGRAFDYNIESKDYILFPETVKGKIYFITYIKNRLEGTSPNTETFYSKGETVKLWQGGSLKTTTLQAGQWLNFTAIAKHYGFERIPAWSSWYIGKRWSNTMEYWHYQYITEKGVRLTWQTAMDLLRQPLNSNIIPTINHSLLRFGDNDADDSGLVTVLQKALVRKGYLRAEEVDGFFRKQTLGALMAFQKDNGLTADGVCGSATWTKLDA